jgi:hypothetical protein
VRPRSVQKIEERALMGWTQPCVVVVMACDDQIFPLQERIETVGGNSNLQEVSRSRTANHPSDRIQNRVSL